MQVSQWETVVLEVSLLSNEGYGQESVRKSKRPACTAPIPLLHSPYRPVLRKDGSSDSSEIVVPIHQAT